MIGRAAFVFALTLAGCAKGAATSNDRPDLAGGGGGELGVDDGGAIDPTTDPLASSLSVMRSVMHVHSPFSHDACDGDGLPGGVPNPACLADLRAAVCSTGLEFVGLTDHPAHMKAYSMDGELLFDASKGDQAIVENGVTMGNRLKCDDGHTVLITEGYESTHTLPIAFGQQPTLDSDYDGIQDARPLADVQTLVADLKAHGAVVSSAHSEESDLTADRLLQAGVDAMEWYNPHGNFKTVLGAEDGIGLGALDALSVLGDMTPFFAGSDSGAHPDLVYLLLLPKWPQAGFDKWRTVQRTRTVTGMFGSDVHQNVSIDPICTGALAVACQLAAMGSTGKTKALALLASGGHIIMSDGQRLDSYARMFRWLENRILVADRSVMGVRDALRAGRNFGLFGVFGEPDDFRFVGQAGGTLLEMGAQQKGPIALTVRLPKRAVQLKGAQWTPTEGALVEIHASLFKTTATETTLVKDSKTLGDTITFNATEPAAYHVEVWMKPKHLVAALGTQSGLADTEYMWLITNPIRLLP